LFSSILQHGGAGLFLSKTKTKILANLLICLIFLTNPACILAAQAATVEETTDTQDTTTFTVDKSFSEQGLTATDSNSLVTLTEQEKKLQFSNNLLKYYLEKGKNQGPQWLKTTDIEFMFTQDHKPIYSVESLQPLGKVTTDGSLWFWQGRYAHESGGSSTANIGLGWRKLSSDKSSMIGLNTFYDYGFEYNLARIGLGTEYFNKQAEFRANWYFPVSGERQTGVNELSSGIIYSYIRAVEGIDFEAGTSFSHIPWLKFFAGGFYWDNKYNPDERGYRLRSTMQLTPKINMELGYMGSNLAHSFYGNVKYQSVFDLTPDTPVRNKQQTTDSMDLTEKLLQKVERENDIKTESYTKFVSYTGSIKTTVTNSVNSTALAGATVQAYQNGAPVGSAATTDASGNAIISGLAVGNYTVYVTYGSYSGTSSSVPVTKDTTAPAAVSLAVSGGSVTIKVVNAQSVAVSGATIVATLSSATVAVAPRSLIDTVLDVKTAYAGTSGFSVSAITDANGIASFTNLPSGTYTFRAAYNGYSINSEPVAVISGGSINNTLRLPLSGGNLRAIVKDANGAVLSGAAVTVLSGTSTVATSATDANGVAIISGIAAGTYTVSASLANYTVNTASNVTVIAGETTTASISLASISSGGIVSLTLTGTYPATGDYMVTLTNTATPSLAYTGTVRNGATSATINSVPVGNYSVTVSAPGGYDATVAPTSITTASGQTIPVSITSRQQTGSVTLKLDNVYPTTGDYTVTLTSVINPSITYTGTVNGSATSTTVSVPAGKYTLTVSAPSGYLAILNPTSVNLTDGQTTAIDVTSFLKNGTVSVSLNGASSATGNYTVTLTNTVDASLKYSGTVSRGAPSAAISVSEGNYTVTVSPPYGYDAEVSPTIIDVAFLQTIPVTITSSPQTGNVTVSLTGAYPVSGDYTVTLTNTAEASLTYTATVNSGATSAVIHNVPVASYAVTVSAPNGYSATVSPTSINVTNGQTIPLSVTSSQQTDGQVTVNLTGTYPMTGNYMVTLTNMANPSLTYTGTVESGTASATINNVAAGSYAVSVAAPLGYFASLSSTSITVVAGQTIPVVVTSRQQTGQVTVSLTGTYPATGDYTVTLTDTANPTVTYTGTVNSGVINATISSVPIGNYAVTVSAPGGYSAAASSTTITVINGQTTAVSVTSRLQTGTVTVSLTGAYPATGDYTVTLYGVPNASITYTGTVNSGATGATINGVTAGSYLIMVSAPGGYSAVVASTNITVTDGQTTAVSVTSRLQTGTVTVSLTGAYPATGDYTVTLTSTANPSLTYSGTVNSGATGATISSVPIGSYAVTVSAPGGYSAAVASTNITVTDGQTILVGVTSRQQASQVTVSLTGTYPATGDYTVTLTDTAAPSLKYTCTVNSGLASTTISVSAGSYAVTVSAPDGYNAVAAPTSITVTDGQTAAVSVTSSLQTGSVKLSLNGPAPDQYFVVTLTNTQNPSLVYSGSINSTSTMLYNVLVGTYAVEVSSPAGFSTISLPPVIVTNGRMTDVIVRSYSAGSVAVSLTGTYPATGDYTVTLVNTSNSSFTYTKTVNSGLTSTVINNVALGTYNIVVSAPVDYSATTDPAGVLEVYTYNMPLNVISNNRSGSVSLEVSGTVGLFQSYTVTLTNRANRLLTFTTTVLYPNESKIGNVPTGSYDVSIVAPSGYTATVNPASPVTIQPGNNKLTINPAIRMYKVILIDSGATPYDVIDGTTTQYLVQNSTSGTTVQVPAGHDVRVHNLTTNGTRYINNISTDCTIDIETIFQDDIYHQ
jgi:sRNA-binding regulator protein Hfq